MTVPAPLLDLLAGKDDRMKVSSQTIEQTGRSTRERDDVLCRLARELLGMSGYRPLGRLECRVHDGVIELHGTVSSFFLKQMAQTVVLQLSGSGVRNCVRVQ